MKKFLIMLFAYFVCYGNSFAQLECFMENPPDSPESSGVFDNIQFFPQSDCDPYVINCNFVFLTREDGSGAFPANSPIVNNLINAMNSMWSSVGDPGDCSPDFGYPIDSKVRMNINTHYIANEAAWDYYAQATSMNSYSKYSFCPTSVIANPGTWPTLKQEVEDFAVAHPNAINFFFVENGAHLEYLEDAVNSGQGLSAPWNNPDNIDIFGGCSRFAANYRSNQNQFIVIADFFTEWYKRIHFADVYYPSSGVSNETNASWHLNDMPKLNNHELGHTLLDAGHTCGCHNLMIGGGCNPSWDPIKQYLTPDQLEDIHEVIATTNIHKYVECSDYDYCDLFIAEDATIDQPMSAFGDIYIEDNATLTITSEVYLGRESSIYVMEGSKLILDGALLSNECDETWEGIKVVGGNADFDVKILNSTIENTSDAAVSMMPPLPWPEQSYHGNGILHADNSTFNNTNRIVELIAFQPSFNSSYVKNCIQFGGNRGISNWNCQDVLVEGNTFYNIEEIGIITHSGSFDIVSNEFHSVERDIFFADISAGQGTLIKDNKFFGDGVGVYALGTSLDQIRIARNEFNNGKYAIYMDGDNNYEIKQNTISESTGVVALNNGNHSNNVIFNVFQNNPFGIITDGANPDFSFYLNCFESQTSDVSIVGSVSPIIEYNGQAANNCFTHQGVEGAGVFDISGSPNPFTYIEPADQVVDCKDPILADPTVNIIESGNSLNVCSNSSGLMVNESSFNYCSPDRNIADVQTAQDWLNDEIRRLKREGHVNMVHHYNRCLQNINRVLFELYIKEKKFVEARTLMRQIAGEDAKIAVYNTFVFENDLPSAKNHLNNLKGESETLDDYIFVQQIYLGILKNGRKRKVSQSNLIQLKEIALKRHPYAAYAKSLYYFLTRELISTELNIPRSNLEKGLTSINNNVENEIALNIFPNPAKEIINIEFLSDELNEGTLSIVNMQGQKIVEYSLSQEDRQMRIDVNNFAQGVYLIQFNLETGQSFSQKIIISK